MYKPHPDFDELDDDKLLWRYMDLPRYIDLLIRSALFFCRSDCFEDPFEGKYNKPSEEQLLKSEDKGKADELIKLHGSKRLSTTISSWHQNDLENYAMWQIYARGDFGLAIQTSYKHLKQAFEATDKDVFIGKVFYIDEADDLVAVENNYKAFLCKRKIYSYENEVRCCYSVTNDLSDTYNWTREKEASGVFVPVDLSCILQSVYISPNSPAWFKHVVEDINSKYNVTPKINHSSVFESLHYI